MKNKKIISIFELMRVLKYILASIIIVLTFLSVDEVSAQCGPYQYYTGSNQLKMSNDGWITSGGA